MDGLIAKHRHKVNEGNWLTVSRLLFQMMVFFAKDKTFVSHVHVGSEMKS